MSPDPEVLSSRLGSGPLRCLRGSSRLRSLRVGVAGAGLREVGALGRRGMWDKKREISHKNGDLYHKNGDLYFKNGDLYHKNGDLYHKNCDLYHKNCDLYHKNGDL